MGSREEPDRNFTENGSGIPEVVAPVPPLILYNIALVRFHLVQQRGIYPNATNDHIQTLSIEWGLRISRCT